MSENKASISDYKLPGMRSGMNKRGATTIEKPKNGKAAFKRLVNYFTNEKLYMLLLLIAVSVGAVCTVYVPKLQSRAIDSIADGAFDSLSGILAMMLAVYLVNNAFTLVQGRVSAILSQSIVSRMRKDLFERIVNLPIRYLDSHPHGDIMSRMTNDIENISNTVSQSLSSLVSGILTMLGTVVMMVYFCPSLALLSCTTVILTLGTTKYLSTAMRKFYIKRQIILGELNSTVEEMVGGYHTVAAYDRQSKVIEQFNKCSDELTHVGIIAEILGGSMGPVMNVINNTGFVIIAAFGGYFALKEIISIGVISAFIVYAKQFGRPLDELAQIYGQIQTAIAGAERVFAIMDEACEDKTGSHDMEGLKGNISFKNVDFSYVEGKQVLHGFDFDVRAGHKIALVGSTGSGKTTVVNLLMRFYDIDSGAIEIDGINIKDIDCCKLRRDIAIVLQDTVLFSDSIKNNLKYSNEHAADEEIEAAAKISHCHQMIMNLPEGYDTQLTQAGFNLSQGQRQLLSIARAFIAKPKILILDEATSSVDTRTEKYIQDAMVKLMENRTSLIIAHRLSTIQDADCIVVLDNGSIVETGSHDELLAQQGRYYELYMTQFEGNAT